MGGVGRKKKTTQSLRKPKNPAFPQWRNPVHLRLCPGEERLVVKEEPEVAGMTSPPPISNGYGEKSQQKPLGNTITNRNVFPSGLPFFDSVFFGDVTPATKTTIQNTPLLRLWRASQPSWSHYSENITENSAHNVCSHFFHSRYLLMAISDSLPT